MSPPRFAAILFMFVICSLTALADEAPSQVPSLTLTILDESGQPIPKAKLSFSGTPKPFSDSGYRKYTEANENGRFVIKLNPDSPQQNLSVFVEPAGYTFFLAGWGGNSGNIETDPIPAEFAVELEKAATVGGIVLDDTGKPLADVSVEFFMPWGKRSRVKQPNHYVHCARAKTDENGVWKYESVPLELLDSRVRVSFDHKDYMKTAKEGTLSQFVASADGTFASSVRLEQGIMLTGRVTDTSGKPIAGAVVIGKHDEHQYGHETITETNENGEYAYKNWAESPSAFVGVWKTGMMALLKNFPVGKENPSIDFTMQPAGKPVTIKIVDKNGNPIEGFYLAIERWGAQRMPGEVLLTGKDRPRTDENGRWTWNEAPDEEVVFDMFLNENYMDVRNKSVVPRDEEYVFVSGDSLKVSGNITDAETGEMLPKFNVYFGKKFSNNPQTYWEIKRGAGGNGTYRVGENYAVNISDFAVKIEAEGYETAFSRDIQPDEGNITLDFPLKKLSAGKTGIFGIVLQPDGKPVEGITVAMATHGGGRPYIQNGQLHDDREPYTISTDKDGKFKFAHIDFEAESQGQHYGRPDQPKVDYLLFFLHDSGFKRLTQQDWESLGESKTITLEPWGRVEGTVKVGTQPGKNVPVQSDISFSSERDSFGNEPHVFWDYRAAADVSGHFLFTRIPAGFVTVSRTMKFNDTGSGFVSTGSHSADRIELKPGETATVTLGGVGRPVVGKLIPASEFEAPPDWRFSHIECTPASGSDTVEYPHAAAEELRKKMVPKDILEETDMAKRMELSRTWMETEEGKKFIAASEELVKDYREAQERNNAKRFLRRVCAVAKDGTFQLDDIFEGDWTLKVTLDSPPPPGQSCGIGEQIGTLERKFFVTTIPEIVSDEPLDLGTLEVRYAPTRQMPKVGEVVPEFEITKIEPISANGTFEDKGNVRLSDYKEKYVILDFWATWCGPCLEKLPELKTLYEKIKDDDRFVMIGISLDNAGSEEVLGKFIARQEMTWLHGLSGDWQSDMVREYGVHAIPALLLIGPDGRVLLSNPSMAELAKKVEELRNI